MPNEWTKSEHAEAYLARMDRIPHRQAGESTLLSEISSQSMRVLDLGCGNGHLLSLVLAHCPEATGIGLDFSDTMLQQAQSRFAGDPRVTLVTHNMDHPLPDLGQFDCVVSSFAIHHCSHDRKRKLYREVFTLLEPGGVFCNLEHVSSPTDSIHDRFIEAMGMTPEDEDPSNQLLDVQTQLDWLRVIGFEEVDCCWKWRELALLSGHKPVARLGSGDHGRPSGSIYGTDLACIHDVGFSSLSESWAPGILELLRDSGIESGLIVDLGCGAGGWIEHLAKAGFEAVGVDVSPAMIERAKQRVRSATFHVDSVWECSIPRCRAVTALSEVVCYRSEDGDEPAPEKLFQTVLDALEPGGMFIFDVAEIGLDKDRGSTFTEGEDWTCLVEYEYDERNHRLLRNITTFRKVNSLFRKSREQHVVQLFDAKEVVQALEAVGFQVQVVRAFGSAPLLPQRAGFIARKIG